ncbi:MAG: hypothetical protein KJN63_04190 [Acidimicrobiia bacterium]|nr:hypothetical protein [Acidimicrobiia bacterium]
MTAVPTPTTESEWTLADERAFLDRQRRNEQAVRFSTVVSASAIVLGAILSVYALVGGPSTSDIPSAPVDPLALQVDGGSSTLAYETADIAAVAEPALDFIRYPWRSELQGWTIAFLEPRGRASGYTWSAERRIEVFVADDDGSERVARVLAHELGHAVDVTLNDSSDRRAWLAERQLDPDAPWWPGDGRPDFETGAGDFAEVFAASQIGEKDFKSKLNLQIDQSDYDLMARLSLRR